MSTGPRGPIGSRSIIPSISKTELATTITADKDYYFQIFPAGARVATAGAYGAAVSHKLGIAGIGDAEAKALMQDMKR